LKVGETAPDFTLTSSTTDEQEEPESVAENITVYVKTGCPWCIGLKKFLQKHDIQFKEMNVTESREAFDEMVEKSGQSKAPVVEIDGHLLIDTDADEVEEYLKKQQILV